MSRNLLAVAIWLAMIIVAIGVGMSITSTPPPDYARTHPAPPYEQSPHYRR